MINNIVGFENEKSSMACLYFDNSFRQIICLEMAYKLEFRKSIYNLVGRMPKPEIVGVFENLNISRRTIYRTIAECEQGIPCLNLPKSGRPRIFTQERADRLVSRAKNRIGVSMRKLGREYRTSKDTVSRELDRNGLKYRKRKKCPKYTANQLARIP